MTSYNSTARVPFAKGGKVDKKPIKPKRIILWKGKAKDWPGPAKFARIPSRPKSNDMSYKERKKEIAKIKKEAKRKEL